MAFTSDARGKLDDAQAQIERLREQVEALMKDRVTPAVADFAGRAEVSIRVGQGYGQGAGEYGIRARAPAAFGGYSRRCGCGLGRWARDALIDASCSSGADRRRGRGRPLAGLRLKDSHTRRLRDRCDGVRDRRTGRCPYRCLVLAARRHGLGLLLGRAGRGRIRSLGRLRSAYACRSVRAEPHGAGGAGGAAEGNCWADVDLEYGATRAAGDPHRLLDEPPRWQSDGAGYTEKYFARGLSTTIALVDCSG